MYTRSSVYTFCAVVVAAVLTIPMLSGCGGTGGSFSVAGVVSDVEGNVVPDATVRITGAGSRSTTTAFNGAYKFNVTESGWQMLTAVATIDGVTWRGTQAVQVFSDGPTMNVNITIGPASKLGSISGNVRDASDRPVDGARVFVTMTYGSAFAITDLDGTYTISDLPATVSVGGEDTNVEYVVTASKVGFANETKRPINVTAGGVTNNVNFVLTASSGVDMPAPENVGVLAWTLPETVSRSASPYDAIRAKISPKVRKMLASRQATRFAPPGSLIEIDVLWDYAATTDEIDNLAGFSIFRRAGANPSFDDRIYFERQPGLRSFADMDDELTDGTEFVYAVSALNTNFLDPDDEFDPNSESGLSNFASAIPLGKLNAITPSNGGSANASTLRFSWNPVSGARSHMVFIYDTFPELQDTGAGDPPVDQVVQTIADIGPTTGTSIDGPSGLAPGGYYWVVIGTNANAATPADFVNNGSSYTIGQLRRLTIN